MHSAHADAASASQGSRRSTRPWNELRTLASLYKLYRSFRPDVVHHVALKPVLYGSLVARIAGTRRVINAVAGFGYSFVASGVRAAAARRVLDTTFRVLCNRTGSKVLVQNPDDERVLVEDGMVGAGRVVVIPGSGVDTGRFAPGPDEARDGNVRVTLVSRMLWSKGVGEFVDAARILRRKGVEFEAVLNQRRVHALAHEIVAAALLEFRDTVVDAGKV